MRHKKIHKIALKLDRLIRKNGRGRLPSRVRIMAEINRHGKATYYLGSGKYKRVFHIKATEKDLALKVGKPKAIKRDWEVYAHAKRKGLANRYFGKCYWHTEYCMLQKFGKEKRVPLNKAIELKRRANEIGLGDVGTKSNRNIRYFDGRFKIIDAGFK